MSFIRRYWIAGLVLLLVIIHAVMIGYVRSEATRLKTIASSEIPIGLFYKQSSDREWCTQMRVHLLVPPEQRLAARATIDHNRWVVHEAVEEAIRRMDQELLTDPALVAVKEEIKKAIDEVLREEIVEKVVINDRVDLASRDFKLKPIEDPTRPGEESNPADRKTLAFARPMRTPTSEQIAEQQAAEAAEHAEEGHGEEEGGEAGGHGAEPSGHGAPAKSSSSGHGAPAKEAKSSGGHGAAKSSSSGHGAAKSSSSGHGAAKKGH